MSEHGAAEDAVSGDARGFADLRRHRVLLVDDEAGIRDLFSMIIEQDLPAVQLDEAEDGAAALELFKRQQHDVLILDLHMPVMDGLTAFGRIRKLCENDARIMPAVIFCTGFAPPNGVREIVSASARHALLSKPVRSDVLVAAIRRQLRPPADSRGLP